MAAAADDAVPGEADRSLPKRRPGPLDRRRRRKHQIRARPRYPRLRARCRDLGGSCRGRRQDRVADQRAHRRCRDLLPRAPGSSTEAASVVASLDEASSEVMTQIVELSRAPAMICPSGPKSGRPGWAGRRGNPIGSRPERVSPRTGPPRGAEGMIADARFPNAPCRNRASRRRLDPCRHRHEKPFTAPQPSRGSSPATCTGSFSRSCPDLDRYVDLNSARTRKQYTLWDRRVEAGDPERTALWRAVSDAISAQEIQDALRQRLETRAAHSREGQRRGLAGANVSATRALRRLRRLRDQAASGHPPEGVDGPHLHARRRQSSGTRDRGVQDLPDGGVPLEVLRPRQGEDRRRSCPTPASPSSSSTPPTVCCIRVGTAGKRFRSTTPSPG